LLAGKVCLWGGVNGFMTAEQGKPADVRKAVKGVIRTLAAGGGFILSPVENIRENAPRVWENARVFIDARKEMRG